MFLIRMFNLNRESNIPTLYVCFQLMISAILLFVIAVISVRTKGGLRYEEKVPKFSQVTVHTARRSFATNMFLAEVHPLKIMKITGHRTEKAFLRYIRISQAAALF